MDSLSVKFERKKLYDEIWEISLTGVSKKYGLNYTKLVQVCKENNIPYPSSGYWTKKNMGLDFLNEIVELPEAEEKEIEVLLKNTGVLINEKVFKNACSGNHLNNRQLYFPTLWFTFQS